MPRFGFDATLGGGGGISTEPPKPTQVFAPPQGLLDFLGTKTTGHNPDLFAQLLQPTLNLMPFYLAGQEIKRAAGAAANVGTIGVPLGVTFTVPAGHAWMPLFQCVSYTPGAAGETITAKAVVIDPGNIIIQAAASAATQASFGQSRFAGNDWWINPILVPASFSFACTVEATTFVSVGATVIHALSYFDLVV